MKRASKNIQNDDSVDQSWIVYQGRGKFGPDKTQVSYTQAPNSADLFPFDFEGKMPTSDTELMVSKDFAQKHNLQLNSKVSSPDVVASISDPNTGTTREYTITGIFDVGFSGSDTNNAMFIGGTSYGEAANKVLKMTGGASSANYAVPGASMVNTSSSKERTTLLLAQSCSPQQLGQQAHTATPG